MIGLELRGSFIIIRTYLYNCFKNDFLLYLHANSLAGITAIIQPGGSIKDELSIDYCNANNVAMVMTGVRHFKH